MLDLLNGLTQDTRLLRLSTPLGQHKLIVECVRGEEGLSRCFEFKVSALSTDAAISARSLLGQPALLELLTSASRTQLRPFHGHITAVESLGADGGLGRYALTLSPWYAFLAHGRDSRVFQDLTVIEILDAVFGSWAARGTLAPAWRFDLRERSVYPKRSFTAQYQESSFHFAERLMHEEGLFYYFEHAGDAAAPGLGSHTLVIADHNGIFKPNVQAQVAFSQPGAVMQADTIDRWRSETRLLTNTLEMRSWDYRARGERSVSAMSAHGTSHGLASTDAPGLYAWPSREQGQRMIDHQIQALDCARKLYVGAGTVRTFAPATTFTLHGQAQCDLAASDDARTFAIVRVLHLAHNNLSTEVKSGAEQLLGPSPLACLIDKEQGSSLHAVGKLQGERPLYRTRVDAIAASLPYRSMNTDGHGVLLHPRPRVRGQQTAIVVGPPGAVIHTDRDHRIKVQFHWQRGAGDNDLSHNRLNHPAPEGHTGAPGTDKAGVWLRVATPLGAMAGANWGAVAVPRVGSEVLVDFIDGDIDRPVVVASLYNGKGEDDAQNNTVSQGAGVATGNAPPWFPGNSGAHAHPAALSGLKSQDLKTSQSGAGGYSQLVFDDSAGQARLALQRHAEAHKGSAELNLGQLRHQSDNQRLAAAGFGAELKTEHSAALRTGQGLLMTTEARINASGGQLDAPLAHSQVEASQALQVSMAALAQKHNARLAGEGEPDKLAAIAAMAHSGAVLAHQGQGASGAGNHGGQGKAAAWPEPHLQLSGPAGIAALTPASAVITSGGSSSLTAAQDINFIAQGGSYHAVSAGISLFTYGKTNDAARPVTETGIRLHAATGKVSSQSQSGTTSLTADKAITVASTTKGIRIAAKNHVMLTAQGAFLKLEGGNIMIHGPGKIEFKASKKELGGPQSASFVPPALPMGELKPNQLVLERVYHDLEPLAGAPYQVFFADGTSKKGRLDGAGRSVLDNVPSGAAKVMFGPMPGAYARKDLTPMPAHNPAPRASDIDAIIDKYANNDE